MIRNGKEPGGDLLQTKQHFEILDGLRGIAALAVVIFHFMEFATPDYKDNFIAHAYLAVDFFFCLSGFVLAYAYDAKLEKIGLVTFFKLRLIRLHPLVLVGSVLGLATFVFDPFSPLYSVYGPGQTFRMFVASCLMIPYPVVHERYFNLFHLNPPTWSLFWEYMANVAYALVLIRLRHKLLWVLILAAAVCLCFESYRSSYLGVGWGGDNMLGGGVRVFYSFLAGILLYRLKWVLPSRLGFMSLGLLLAAAFLIPFSEKANWYIDVLVVIFYFPFLVALGAGARLTPAFKKICLFSGKISYPLYMVHYPFLWLFLSYIEVQKPTLPQLSMIIPVAALLLILLAYFIMVVVDVPLRTYLKRSLTQSVPTLTPVLNG